MCVSVEGIFSFLCVSVSVYVCVYLYLFVLECVLFLCASAIVKWLVRAGSALRIKSLV